MNKSINLKYWTQFEDGRTIGQAGSEQGIILQDESFQNSARITLERGGVGAPFAITCGVSGWLVHTRFFATEALAQKAIDQMKPALSNIVSLIPERWQSTNDVNRRRLTKALSDFLKQFP